MVQREALDQTFSALSDPTRRDILERLGRGPASLSELAKPFDMSVTGLKKHITILEETGLVVTERVGRTRQCRLGPACLEDAVDWIGRYRQLWERRLEGLEAYIERKKEERQ